MILRGIPDFEAPFEVNEVIFYPAVGETDHLIHLPRTLEIAPRQDRAGGLDFSVELVRGQSPFLPPEPYGVLDFRMRPAPLSDTALAALREAHPSAGVRPVSFQRGYLRLQVMTGGETLGSEQVAEFSVPFPLVSNGLDAVRFVRRLSHEAATLLKKMLEEETLTFSAVAEMVVLGLAPRVPARVTFQTADLLAALSTVADDEGRLTYEDLMAFWMQEEEQLPLMVAEGFATGDRAQLARALVDWTVAAFADAVAAPGEAGAPTFRLRDETGDGDPASWDLTQEKAVPRVVLLRLNPFEAAQQLVTTEGLEAVWRETVVPPLQIGVVTITVGANLPEALRGVLKLGVNLLAPPKPPLRPHPLSDTLLFDDPEQLHRVNWRFSPQEPVAYEYTTFALLHEDGVIHHLSGTPSAHGGTYLLVGADDFPLSFVSVAASRLLLQEAVVRGVCRRGEEEDASSDSITAPDEVAFELTSEQPRVSLALPRAAVAAFEISLEACSREDGTCLTLGSFPAQSISLDLPSLPQYGPQTVEIEVEFDQDVSLVVLNLLPEESADDPEQASVLAFTPATPIRQWRYFAHSPFRAGYLYRRRNGAASDWSAVQLPFSPLTIKASGQG